MIQGLFDVRPVGYLTGLGRMSQQPSRKNPRAEAALKRILPEEDLEGGAHYTGHGIAQKPQ